MNSADDQRGDFAALVAKGAPIVGAGIGATLGIMGIPELSVVGAMAGQALGQMGADFANRVLSHREQVRIGGVLGVAAAALVERQVAGTPVRADGFFDGERSNFDEIVEGVLLSAKAEYEEHKVPYMGNLIASIATDSDIDINLANALIELTDRLSWLDLQILAIFSRRDEFPLPEHDRHLNAIDWSGYSVLRAVSKLGLGQEELIHAPMKQEAGAAIPTFDLKLSATQLQSMGALLVETLQLEKIPKSELLKTYRHMCEPPVQDE